MNETGPRGHSHVIRAVCARARVFTHMHASLHSDLELMPGSPVGTSRCGERGPCNAFGREVQHYVQSERRPDCILKITSPWQVVGVQKSSVNGGTRNAPTSTQHTPRTISQQNNGQLLVLPRHVPRSARGLGQAEPGPRRRGGTLQEGPPQCDLHHPGPG